MTLEELRDGIIGATHRDQMPAYFAVPRDEWQGLSNAVCDAMAKRMGAARWLPACSTKCPYMNFMFMGVPIVIKEDLPGETQ